MTRKEFINRLETVLAICIFEDEITFEAAITQLMNDLGLKHE